MNMSNPNDIFVGVPVKSKPSKSARAKSDELLRQRTEEWQAAIQQNAILQEALEYRRRQIDAMHRVSEAMVEKLDADSVARRTLGIALEVLNAQSGSLQLYDAEQDTLVFRHVIGPGADTLIGYVMPASQGISGQVLRTGVPDVTRHVRQHGGLNPMLRGQSAGPQVETMATAPLKRPTGDAIGVLQLLAADEAGFEHDDLEVLQVLCAQVAAALETARLVQQARQAEIVNVIGDISHDIKNMLTPIQSGLLTLRPMLDKHFIELERIRQRCHDSPVSAEIENSAALPRDSYQWIFDGAIQSCERVETRTREIADAVKGEIAPPNFEVGDLNQIVQEVALPLSMLAAETNVRLHLELDAALPSCQFDRKQMYTALYNLVSNAIPETPSGHSVTIRTRAPEPGQSTLLLQVEDTGRGMSEAVRTRLFSDATVSTKVGGTGLGTRIVAGVVRRHKGTISVHSEEGRGSTFSIRLPLTQDDTPADSGDNLTPRLPARRDNLPANPGPLIGREAQRRLAVSMLKSADTRMLTLSGAGGIGKTHLAVQVAHDLRDEFADGAWFVSLAPLDDPALAASSVAAALGVREEPGQPLLKNLTDYLRTRRLLLVLDNFEQIVEAAPMIENLVQQCPELRVLITSRSPLHVTGEHELSLQPLQLPTFNRVLESQPLSHAEITKWKRSAAVALFIERARQVMPDFALTRDNARDIAEICTRLDGLPLAIELAAARIKVLSPGAMRARLDNRLQFLEEAADVARETPARHQTLRAAIDWSYDLLDASHQTLLRRVMTFDGGCTVASARAICVDDPHFDVEAGLKQLADENLLRCSQKKGRAPWYWALETIHEYGLEKMQTSGEIEALRKRHAAYYLAVAESAQQQRVQVPDAKPPLPEVPPAGSSAAMWLEWRKREDANLRAALRWFLDHAGDSSPKDAQDGLAHAALRMALALRQVWNGNFWNERREALRHALEQSPDAPDALQLLATLFIGDLANLQADTAQAEEFGHKSLETSARCNDLWGRARALGILGNVALAKGDLDAARAFHQESLVLFGEDGSHNSAAWTLYHLGAVARRARDKVAARDHYEQSLTAFRQMNDKQGTGWALYQLGQSDYQRDDPAPARRRLQESLSIFREIGNLNGVAWTLCFLGRMDVEAEQWTQARAHLVESLDIARRLGDRTNIATALRHLSEVALASHKTDQARTLLHEAAVTWRAIANEVGLREVLGSFISLVVAEGQMELAARLLGAVAASEGYGQNESPDSSPDLDLWQKREAVLARGILGEVAFASAWQEGQTWTTAQAMDAALAM